MSAYQRFIEDAATRLELGPRTRWVVEVLIAWVASHPHGLDGLQERFEQAGLAARFHSWRYPGALRLPIVASELERALGAHTLAMIAHRSGMSPGPFRVVASHLLPGIVTLLSTPLAADHATPAVIPMRGSAAPRRMRSMVPSRAMYGMALRSLLWAMAVVALLGLTTWLLMKARTPLWAAQDIPREHDALLSLQQHGTQLRVHGRLPTEGDRRRTWNALSAVHGRHNLQGGIALDPSAQAPRWLDRLIVDLPRLQGDGLRLEFSGAQLRVDTTAMDDAERRVISRQLRQDFPMLEMSGLWGPGLAALAQLPSGADTAQRVAAMNQTTLKFHAGSSELTGDSRQTLEAVADALRSAPDGKRVEIGAHTDGRGHAEANLQLSQQRAEAVSNALQARGVPATSLVAVGYGQDRPIADNRSDSGRAQNRRIDYQLLD
ncbi:OmpA family protein [Stenotrophomonas sp.]|uniref:OmpA family protein n=1 Tax=Stenotrophomonas sp. TaxID=69392 RepID=UPI00289633A7|nr:OmpA family protein [Stenotrophomonas sp.]